MAKKKNSGWGFWSQTPEGHTVHISGRRDMPQETLDALLRIMDLAHKNATEVMKCGHTKSNLVKGGGDRWFCGQCVLDEAEAKD